MSMLQQNMRSDQKEQNQHTNPYVAANYEDENKLLRELFLERARTMQQQKKQQQKQQISDEDNEMKQVTQSSIKQMVNEVQQSTNKYNDNFHLPLYLNTLLFDTRPSKPPFFIKIFSLLNEDPSKPTKSVSENVQCIFITTFGFETETFEHLLSTSKVKLVVLNDSEEKEHNKVIKNYSGFENFTVILKCKNQSQRYGVFHTKLWLIKFKTFLRVVVCTSNQHIMDWSVWLNAYWYQDFPLKSNPKPVLIGEQDQSNIQLATSQNGFNLNEDFKKTLHEVLQAMLPDDQLLQHTGIKLDNYLFQGIKVVLIPSIPGRHYGANIKKQGIGKMKQIMKAFNKASEPIMTYNSTSLGIIERGFVQQLYQSFCPKNQIFQNERFRLVYPTKKYIEQETGGQASVLFLTSQNYKKSGIAAKILHRFETNPMNRIQGCIPHLKTVLIEPRNQDENSRGVLYVGSHNMTKAAWGKYQKQGSQLYIANSELGILFFDVDLKWYRSWSPFRHPPEPYKQDDQPFLRDFK